ncbi:DUF3267 domain-containing protein [Clostridium manihotivorum]
MGVVYVLPGLLGSDFNRLQTPNTFVVYEGNSLITFYIRSFYTVVVIALIFIVHELLHIIVIYKKDNISFTHSGLFFWINTNAILSKMEFWFYMTLPIIGLSLVPFIISIFVSTGYLKSFMLFIAWVNLIIASSDIINSILILIKPNNTLFCRGYYRKK